MIIGGVIATRGESQTSPAQTKVAEPKEGKGESDDEFIRRVSKDLRGIDPSPAEVHFFVNNKDAGKRQRLIDLFIQERQAKQAKQKEEANYDKIVNVRCGVHLRARIRLQP